MTPSQIEEAQSEAQKAAFQKMLDAKNGNKEETTEDADDDDEVEEVDEAAGQDKFAEFSYDPSRWSENVIEDTLASMDGVAWDPKAGTLTANEGPALEALTVLANSNVGIRHESSGEHGLAQARRMESKSSGDAWYAEQRAKEAYEKETGKSWKDLKYGHKEDWRKKFPAKTESVNELDRVKHLAGI